MKESQLDNKTTIATNDCVRMVDENGNSVKIKKDSFMAAIRDALPSILESGGTGGGSVLSVINGALKTRTDANLASVLGGKQRLLPCLYVKYVPASGGIPSQGWYRLFQTTFVSGMGMGSYMIHVSSGYTDHAPSPMTFLLEASYTYHGLFQIGKKIPSVTSPLNKVRAVQKSRTVYFDINVKAGDNWYVTIYPLNGETSNINTIAFTNVTSEDVGTNVTEVTPA